MKGLLKTVVSLLLAAVLFVTGTPVDGFVVNAGAEETLKATVTYKDDGTAVLTIEASDWMNMVRYTLDGTAPTADSKLYVKALEFTEKTTVRIAEFTRGDEWVGGIKKTVTPKAMPVVISSVQDGEKAIVTMTCPTPEAEIRYTTDGSVPDKDSELYTAPIEVTKKTKFRAKPFLDGYKSASAVSETVTIDDDDDKEEEKDKDEEQEEEKSDEKDEDKKPKNTEPDEVVSNEKINYKVTYMADKGRSYVTLQKAKNTNYFRYTTDGSAPDKSSKKYTDRIKFTEPSELRVKEYNAAGQVVGTLKLKVKLKCADVTFYSIDISVGTNTVVMETETKGATIYYSTDGSFPDPEYSNVYTQPVVLGSNVDLKAVAIKDGYRDGSICGDIVGRIKMKLLDFDFSDPIYDEVADLFNHYRYMNGSHSLILDERLTEAANVRARELAVYFDNKRPNGSSYASIFSDYGLTVRFSTEFVSIYHTTPEELVESIVSDRNNEKQVLGKNYDYNKIGVGMYKKGNAYYWSVIIAEVQN